MYINYPGNFWNSTQQVCPTCGHCPTCGRTHTPVPAQPYAWGGLQGGIVPTTTTTGGISNGLPGFSGITVNNEE